MRTLLLIPLIIGTLFGADAAKPDTEKKLERCHANLIRIIDVMLFAADNPKNVSAQTVSANQAAQDYGWMRKTIETERFTTEQLTKGLLSEYEIWAKEKKKKVPDKGHLALAERTVRNADFKSIDPTKTDQLLYPEEIGDLIKAVKATWP